MRSWPGQGLSCLDGNCWESSCAGAYAPAEVKVLTSADGGNFEEASRWRRTARTEPSFEETIMFATPVSVKAVKVLMREPSLGATSGCQQYAAPYSFMLVSGAAAIRAVCSVYTGRLEREGLC